MANILLVEDDHFIARMYEQLFEHEGYSLSIAEDGIEGLQLAKKENPKLILLDMMLPKLNGMQLLALLKADDQTKNIPVVMLSNVDNKEQVDECMNQGASGYFVKASISPYELLDQVKSFLQ